MAYLERIDLGDYFQFEVNGKSLQASVYLLVQHDDQSYDGDDPEDIAAFERGEFHMYVAEVRAYFRGVTGSDVLGGIAAAKLEDITTCVEEHGMVALALAELAKSVTEIVDAVAAA